jgi:NAD(P)-dependent dehydrogenase (short-subunit alcohol dehydrogenase family)
VNGGGVILHNASICAAQPLWYEPIYNVTKAALVMLSKNLANELIPMGIRVNAINPGLILTPDWVKTAKQLATDGDWEGYLQSVAEEHAPIRRFGTVEELADFFVFLCSPQALDHGQQCCDGLVVGNVLGAIRELVERFVGSEDDKRCWIERRVLRGSRQSRVIGKQEPACHRLGP